MKNKDLKLSIIFTVIGLIAGGLIGLFQAASFTEEFRQQIISQGGSIEILLVAAVIQSGILTFITTFFGLTLARKVNLELNFKFEKDSFILSALFGLVFAFIIPASDKFLFSQYLPAEAGAYEFSLLRFASSVLYGGIIEELMLRLFLMSLLVLILWRIFAKSKDRLSIPDWIYISSIFISAIVFAAGHLPATAQTIGLSGPIIIRSFMLNGIGGIGFGYLYWKKGLAYAILAHMLTHVFMQLIFMPMFF